MKGHVSIVQLYRWISVVTAHVSACRAEEIKAAAWCMKNAMIHMQASDGLLPTVDVEYI